MSSTHAVRHSTLGLNTALIAFGVATGYSLTRVLPNTKSYSSWHRMQDPGTSPQPTFSNSVYDTVQQYEGDHPLTLWEQKIRSDERTKHH
jgi:hypothetical protein